MFEKIDEDHSGRLGKSEIRQLCVELNMPLPETVLDGLLLLADHDGDMSISYAEFARILTADDVMAMKQTTTAVDGAIKLGRGDQPLAENYAVGAKTLEGVKTGLGRH